MGFSPVRLIVVYAKTIRLVRRVARYHIRDARHRHAYALLGPRRYAGLGLRGNGCTLSLLRHAARLAGRGSTGSDTASNVLFGNLQKITSEQLGLSPVLMSAANSSGGVMGKMIDAQSIVVASHRDQLVRA